MLHARMSVVDEVRSAERRDLEAETTIRLDDKPLHVGVFNLSTTGCLIRSQRELPLGTEVRIGLPGVGAFQAEVVRTDGAEAGCRFDRPLTRHELETAFRSDVVIGGNWNPEPPAQALAVELDDELSPRAKLAFIVGISGMLWAMIGGVLHFVL